MCGLREWQRVGSMKKKRTESKRDTTERRYGEVWVEGQEEEHKEVMKRGEAAH